MMIVIVLWGNCYNFVVKGIKFIEVKWLFWDYRVNKKKNKDYSLDIVILLL